MTNAQELLTENWQALSYQEPRPVRVAASLYPKDAVIPPEYVVKGFRPPTEFEVYLELGGKHAVTCTRGMDTPRLILERRKTRKVVFTEVRRGSVQKGEWAGWSDQNYLITQAASDIKHSAAIAYTREDIEE